MLNFNNKYVINYQMSPAMSSYINSLVEPKYLSSGIVIFNGEIIFGQDTQSIIDKIYKNSISKIGKSPNNLYKYGAENVIESAELIKLVNEIFPFVIEYFGFEPTKKLLLYADFSVHYGKHMDTKLEEHKDDSDITVNICLRNNLDSSIIRFSRSVDTIFSKSGLKQTFINFKPNQIISHLDYQLHEVLLLDKDDQDKTDGHRVNLILWFKIT